MVATPLEMDARKPSSSSAPAFDVAAYAVVALLGVALLSPWNITLNSLDYFHAQQYPGDDAHASNFAFILTAANGYPGIPMLFLLVAYGHRVPLSWRICSACALQAACMLLVPLLTPLATFWAPIGIMVVSGVCTIVLQSSVLGLGAMLPPSFNLAGLAGQGVAGILASLAQIVVKVAVSSPYAAALGYFGFAAALMASAGAAYLCVARGAYMQFYLEAGGAVAHHHEGGEGGAGAAHAKRSGGRGAVAGDDARGGAGDGFAAVSGWGEGEGKGGGGELATARLLGDEEEEALPQPSVWRVVRKTWRNLLVVFLVFLMTFMMFPGVFFSVPYKGAFGDGAEFLGRDQWWSIVLLLLFNVCDTIGRTMPSFPRFVFIRESWLLPLTIGRFALVPLLFGCAHSWTPVFGDVAMLLITVVFAFTNGYLASLGIMWAPAHVDAHESEEGGFLMSLIINAGIVTGSNVALLYSS